ncbi:MAG TPA: phospholipase D-like domain-containing protein [Thermoanaerobaculia bacterium]|nr:phospholipase D-like domain-containing protein [Thermoanaerobaculia bacterium]
MRRLSRLPLLLLAVFLALAAAPPAAPPRPAAATTGAPVLELVESFPVETTLDHPDLRDAWQVWPEMIDGARRSLDIAEFYVSNEPGSRLEPVIAAVERAAGRGVAVRLLGDAKFAKTYPDTLARLAKRPGIEVRTIDYGALAGGVLHAKYFLVDGREVYLGSQNFDWRSLQHIQELGVRVVEPAVARAVADLFATDWALAGGAAKSFRAPAPPSGYGFPVRMGDGAGATTVTLVASPRDWLPDESLWDLPRLVQVIDGARSTVRVQLLTYRAMARGEYFDTLESALRRAAARGVQVELLVAHWSQSKGNIEGLQSLEAIPGIHVRLLTVPPWSGGFIPFARVNHAKYLVVDGSHSWIGTGNWESDYFYRSRNLGLLIDGAQVGEQLERFFASGWTSPYSAEVDPCRHYEAPRVAE